MLDSLSQTPNDVARVVHHMYKHEFVCAGVKKICGIDSEIIDGLNLMMLLTLVKNYLIQNRVD